MGCKSACASNGALRCCPAAAALSCLLLALGAWRLLCVLLLQLACLPAVPPVLLDLRQANGKQTRSKLLHGTA